MATSSFDRDFYVDEKHLDEFLRTADETEYWKQRCLYWERKLNEMLAVLGAELQPKEFIPMERKHGWACEVASSIEADDVGGKR